MTRKQITKKAKETFTDEGIAKLWMSTPIRALNNATPNQFIAAGDGAKVVEVLDKIRLGCFR